MAWKDDARLNLDLYGDENNFMLVCISQKKSSPVGADFAKSCNIPIEHATPELIGEAVTKYLRMYFWKD